MSCTTTWSTGSRRPTSNSSTTSRRQVASGALDPQVAAGLLPAARAGADLPGHSFPTSVTSRRRSGRSTRKWVSITLVAQQSTATVNRTIDSVTHVLLHRGPAHDPARRRSRRGTSPAARFEPVEAIRLEAESITGTTMHRRVPEPDTDDEVGRLARTMNAMLGEARDVGAEAAAVRVRRVARAAQSARVDPHQPRGRAAQPGTAPTGPRSRSARWPRTCAWRTPSASCSTSRGSTRPRVRRPIDTLPEVDLDELVLDDTVQQRRVPVDTGRVSAGRVHGRRDQLAACGAQPARQRGPPRAARRSRSSS